MIPPVIRPARREDIPAMARMVERTILRVNVRDYTEAQVRAWAARAGSPERWEQLWDSGLVFFAAESGQDEILGVASADAQGYLHSMFVHGDYQGKGIATALLQVAQSYVAACGTREMYSEVSLTARPFFLRRGFHIEREQVVRVSGVPMVNFRMRKRLDAEARPPL